jgi:hypothetical protein
MEALAVREPLQLCSDQRNFQLDFQIIANRESPGFKRRVPRETEIAAFDPCGCGRASNARLTWKNSWPY